MAGGVGAGVGPDCLLGGLFRQRAFLFIRQLLITLQLLLPLVGRQLVSLAKVFARGLALLGRQARVLAHALVHALLGVRC